jgi:hypothetical protein
MGEIYRVAVQRVVRTIDENGRETDRDYVSVVEFEAAPESLLRFAPAEVAAALGAPGTAVTVYPEPQQVPAGEANEVRETLVPTPHPLAEVVERAFLARADAAVAAEAPAPHPSIAGTAGVHAQIAESAKPTRTRRTKAQKAADDAAQAEGYRDAAHKAEVLSSSSLAQIAPSDGPTGDGDADLAAAATVAQMGAENEAMPATIPVVADPNVPDGVAVMGAAPAVYVPTDPTPVPANTVPPAGSEPPAAPWNPFQPQG